MLMLKIPWNELSAEGLHGLIEEFINREGTDYGEREYSLAEKVEQVTAQIKRGEVLIVFDEELETCNLLPKK
jgi:hypothetical protein